MALRKSALKSKSLSLSDDRFPLGTSRTKVVLSKRTDDPIKTLKLIDDNLIGKGLVFVGPYGRRKLLYGDYATSGKSLTFIEDYIIKEVLPICGGEFGESSLSGQQSKLFWEDATKIIKQTINSSDSDTILFCDNPIEHILSILLQNLSNLDLTSTYEFARIILFVNSSASLENFKIWIDHGAQIEQIGEIHDGFLDLEDLEQKLKLFSKKNSILVGLFTSASRLTGVLADDVATTILLHQFNAISIWNCNPSIASFSLDVNPPLLGAEKDIVYFNGQYLIGGVQASGVLVVKKQLLQETHIPKRDESNLVGAVRIALAMQLKESLGSQILSNRQEKICKQVLSHVRTIPELILVGSDSTASKRLASICFLVRHPRGTYLHHRFVVAVLSDVFGIQTVATNYIGQAIGIGNHLAIEYEKILSEENSNETLRPGYIQLSLPYFISEGELGFVLEALKMVATEGWKLLPNYASDDLTGKWKHHSNTFSRNNKCLRSIRFNEGKMSFSERRISGTGMCPLGFAECLQTARNIFSKSRKTALKANPLERKMIQLADLKSENLRWYMLPGEAHELLLGHSQCVKTSVPFDPSQTLESTLLSDVHRHNSLSALDVKKIKSQSLPGTPNQLMPRSTVSFTSLSRNSESSSSSPVRFSLGGEVTCIPSIKVAQLRDIARRVRCHSWNNQSGAMAFHTDQNGRSCSCSSQTSLTQEDASKNDLECQSSEKCKVGPSSMASVGIERGASSEDIQAYVKEVSKEIATELKSEIREVINTVDIVLETSDSTGDVFSSSKTKLNDSSDSSYRHDKEGRTDTGEGANSPEQSAVDGETWQNLPKDIWRHIAETLDEFDMLRDGDKVLVGVSGSCASIFLVHALRQFSRARGIRITLAAITVGELNRLDPRDLMLHMHNLKIPFIYDQAAKIEQSIQENLHIVAMAKGYSVVATAQTLENLASTFFMTVLNEGKIQTLQAVVHVNDKVKLIRPFLFVRRNSFEKLSKHRNLFSSLTSSPKVVVESTSLNDFLGSHERVNKNMYNNIKSSLKPLMKYGYNKISKTPYEEMKLSFLTRS